MKLFDKEGKGYLDFRAFSQVVTPNMSQTIVQVKKNEIHLPNLVPNKDKSQEYGQKASQLIYAVQEARRSFQPDPEASKLYKYIQYSMIHVFYYRIDCSDEVQF